LQDMEQFLRQAHASGSLHVPMPDRAAEHFFCLVKGIRHMHVLIGLCPVPTADERDAHIAEVVDLFVRAYGPIVKTAGPRALPMPARDRRSRP